MASSGKNPYEKIVYFQDALMKKEGLNSWLPYWAVIKGRWLLFYEETEKGGRPTKLMKTIELPNGSKCAMVPRSKRRFPFSLSNGHGTYYFKCDTELQRYTWIVSVLLASTDQPPKPVPKTVPNEFSESVVDPKMAKFGKKLEYSNKKMEIKKTGKKDQLVSKHRIRYAQRLEAKAKRYLSKSDEDLRSIGDASEEDYEDLRPYSARSAKTHERAQRRMKRDQYNDGDVFYNGTTDIRELRRTSSQSSSSFEIHAQVHSPVGRKNKPNVPIVSVADAESHVMSIVEIENDEFGTVHVISPDEALPNMVVEEKKSNTTHSFRTNKENANFKGLQAPHSMVHSHSMTDLGQINHGITTEDDDVRLEAARPLSASNRTRTGLSGLASPRITNHRKHHAESSSKEKPADRNHQKKGTSPRSPVPKSRYSRYNIPSSDA